MKLCPYRPIVSTRQFHNNCYGSKDSESHTEFGECIGEKCAFWDDGLEQCVKVTYAMSLHEMVYNYVGVKHLD